MSFQFLNPAPVFFDLPGAEPLAGGFLQFYDKGTTTPRDTWSDEALTVLNPNPVPLDAAGRAEFAIWLDGEYSVVIRSSAGETIWTRDYTSGQTAGATIPALVSGRFLTNDGTSTNWQLIREMPDPEGMTGRILSNDGANGVWIPYEIPEPPESDIQVTASVFSAGSAGSPRLQMLTGTGQAPASGGWSTTANISFDPAFVALWGVIITVTTGRVSGADSGYIPAYSVTGWTPGNPASNASVNFVLCEDERNPANVFTQSVPFSWVAIGTVVAAP